MHNIQYSNHKNSLKVLLKLTYIKYRECWPIKIVAYTESLVKIHLTLKTNASIANKLLKLHKNIPNAVRLFILLKTFAPPLP